MVLLEIFMLLSLFFASLDDLTDNMVSDKYTFSFAYLCIVYGALNGKELWLLLVISGCLALILKLEREIFCGLGTADLIIYLGLAAKLDLMSFLITVIVSNLLGIIWYLLKIKKTEKGVAMMPFFFMSTLGGVLC